MAASNNILIKAEDAIKVRLGTVSLPSGATLRVLGDSTNMLALPRIAITADSAEPQPVQTNFRVFMRLEIYTSADDFSRTTVTALVSAIIDNLTTQTIAADLTSDLADFRCFGVRFGNQSQTVDGRHHVYQIEMRMDCCGADV